MATGSSKWTIIAVSAAAGLLLAGCSSSSSPTPSPSPSPTPAATSAAPAAPTSSPSSAVCAAAHELRTSVDTLLHIKIGKGTADEIKSDLANVETKFTALTTELHGEFKAQTNAVKSALDALMKAVSDLKAHFSVSTAAAVTTAASGVAAAVSSLLAALAPQCGPESVSPSP